uniref:Uncharacterized protein n=1 Tax=Anopheles merus TaxID=30066 RepID=A0A182UXV1_ANOME
MASEWRYRGLSAGPPAANSYGYYEQPSAFSSPAAAESQNVVVYSGHPNYYGVPGYEDRRSVGSRRNSWNDPYLQWKWNNYYNRYYYPTGSGAAQWKDRHDGAQYYTSKSIFIGSSRLITATSRLFWPDCTTSSSARIASVIVPSSVLTAAGE